MGKQAQRGYTPTCLQSWHPNPAVRLGNWSSDFLHWTTFQYTFPEFAFYRIWNIFLFFSLIGNVIIVLMPSWHLLDQNYDVSDIEYTYLETKPLGIGLFLKTANHSAVFYLNITEIIMFSQDLKILSYLLLLLFLTLQVKLSFFVSFFFLNAIFRFGYEKNIKANSTFLLFSPTYP